MTKATFTDNITINVVAKDGEVFTLQMHAPVPPEQQLVLSQLFVKYFDENFQDDKSGMVYWVLMRMMGNHGISFSSKGSDRDAERKRIGARIRQIREEKGMEARHLAMLANIDAANLSRIEQGRYSIGLDILSRIGTALGVRVDLVQSE
jgi:DNA-binding Xre family transcriptional regulator